VLTGIVGNFVRTDGRSLNGNERNVLYRNLGGQRFFDVGHLTASNRIEDGRAVVVTDIERDGDLDLVIQNFQKPVVLLVNQARRTRWLQVQLTGTRSNRDAIGARVQIETDGRKQIREVRSTAGYLAGQSPLCHFGLGRAQQVDRLTVRWPSGLITTLRNVPANQRLQIVEPRR